MKLPRRKFLHLAAGAAALPAVSRIARAQAYPTRPVRIIMGFAPGASGDIAARVLAQALGRLLGQQFIVENRTGAGSNIATTFVARAPKDGYTLLMGFSYMLVVNPHIYQKLPYAFEDFAPISLLAEGQYVLVVNPSLPVHGTRGLIDYLKANPGKLNYGSSGVGGAPHMAGELLMARTGTKMVHIPFSGGGLAATSLMAGDIQVLFASPVVLAPLIKAGKLRGLAVTGSARLDILPDLPTLNEAIPGLQVTAWHSLLAPAGTPQPVLDRLHAELMKALASPEIRDQTAQQGLRIISSTPQEVRERVRAESAMWGDVIRKAGITAQ
jgi:tripartite-type tricarboxylate transporter receptor subunit TctC